MRRLPSFPSVVTSSPLVEHVPGLRSIPRMSLGVAPSPIEQAEHGGRVLWIKRDDLNAPAMGGNKVRALEYLLAGVGPGTEVLTAGGVASTHILATALHARALGASTTAYRWAHHVNDTGERVARAIDAECAAAPVLSSAASAYLRGSVARRRHGAHWVPFGGTSVLGMLGHVAAGCELAEQVAAGLAPTPSVVVVPVGSGGTVVGLAQGFGLAGLETRVLAVRCGPALGVNAVRLAWLGARLRRFLRRHAAGQVPAAAPIALTGEAYAGAYARAHPAVMQVVRDVAAPWRLPLDTTYSAKACFAAWQRAQLAAGPVLLWHTFDARWLDAHFPVSR